MRLHAPYDGGFISSPSQLAPGINTLSASTVGEMRWRTCAVRADCANDNADMLSNHQNRRRCRGAARRQSPRVLNSSSVKTGEAYGQGVGRLDHLPGVTRLMVRVDYCREDALGRTFGLNLPPVALLQ